MIYDYKNISIEIWKDIAAEIKGDIEFYIYFKGKKFFGWAFTLDAIKAVMLRYRKTGESCGGIYFLAAGYIILDEITVENICKSINNMIEADGDDALDDYFPEVGNET